MMTYYHDIHNVLASWSLMIDQMVSLLISPLCFIVVSLRIRDYLAPPSTCPAVLGVALLIAALLLAAWSVGSWLLLCSWRQHMLRVASRVSVSPPRRKLRAGDRCRDACRHPTRCLALAKAICALAGGVLALALALLGAASARRAEHEPSWWASGCSDRAAVDVASFAGILAVFSLAEIAASAVLLCTASAQLSVATTSNRARSMRGALRDVDDPGIDEDISPCAVCFRP